MFFYEENRNIYILVSFFKNCIKIWMSHFWSKKPTVYCSLICNDGAERRKWSPYVYWSQKRCHFLLSATLVKCATKNSHYYWLHGEEIWIKCTENWLKFRSCRTSNSRFENTTFTLWTYKVIELNFIQRSSRWDAMKALVEDAPFWWIGYHQTFTHHYAKSKNSLLVYLVGNLGSMGSHDGKWSTLEFYSTFRPK